MPASEQTWRDIKPLHVVFGISSLVMLVVTIWMLAADHTREWKDYQATTRKVEQFYRTGRIREEQTDKFTAEVKQAKADLATARSSAIDPKLVDAFKAAVSEENEDFDFTDLDTAIEQLANLADEAEAARGEEKVARGEATTALQAARSAVAEGSDKAEEAVDKSREAADAASDAAAVLEQIETQAEEKRTEAVEIMSSIVARAKFLEDDLLQKRKFELAEQTATLSSRDIAVGEGKPEEQVAALQAKVDAFKNSVADLTAQYDDAKAYRLKLEGILKGSKQADGINTAVADAEKRLLAAQSNLDQLRSGLEGFWTVLGRKVFGMPILDAFDTSDTQIDQIWLPTLTINYNFSNVPRFDRCITCHRSISDAAAGSGGKRSAYDVERSVQLSLETPKKQPPEKLDDQGNLVLPGLREVYGLELAHEGIIQANDVVVGVVWPETASARAGLQMGDVIEEVNGEKVLSRQEVVSALLADADWGKPVLLKVRRGLPHPYASHPRLDLFMGDASPHKKGEMGCTICHDGQGSATAFKWASHMPNTPDQARQWSREHGWFDNHHWIFPMNPQRFVESGCLKCHHQVTELEPSERFPEPPAPKLMNGYNLVRRYGCFGCHEINGFDGPQKTIGPDLRSEPNYFAVAQAILPDPGLSDQQRSWAQRLVHHPDDTPIRHRLLESINADKELAEDKSGDNKTAEQKPKLSAMTHSLVGQLQDVESPGTFRRVGPSLRFLSSKVEFPFLYSWIRKPAEFRPTTRMPQFFGLWEQLDKDEVSHTEKLEDIEVRAITEYLLGASKPFVGPGKEFDYLPEQEGVTEDWSPERGKKLFETRGCLACHSEKAFPGIKMDQGPDLSNLATKFTGENGAKWLYTWIRKPSLYHVRTKMPDLFLTPITEADGKVTDPAGDITAYLLSGEKKELAAVPSRDELTEVEKASLAELALDHLEKSFPRKRAQEYLQNGITDLVITQIKEDDRILLGETTDENRIAKQLEYVGRRSLGKYGCAGCHDIPGFEAAKPIGTGLADWGRKDPSKLAFEQIQKYLATHGVEGQGGVHGKADHHGEASDEAHEEGHAPELLVSDFDQDTGFFIESLKHHGRQGFLWQKLRQPRSYDYEKTKNKGYNERLKMPQFPFNEKQREEVMTFVLGLVAEPPAAQFVYQAEPRKAAIVEGRKVLDKFNCAGCHVLDMDRWEFDYHEDDFDSPPTLTDFPFLKSHATQKEIDESLKKDRRGLRHAVVHGRPVRSESTGQPMRVDEDFLPIEEGDTESEAFYRFVLWKPTLINGHIRDIGVQELLIRDAGIQKTEGWGGNLSNYLFPVVIADEKQRNPQVKGNEAWGWLPPPLIDQGKKVQTAWMHDFLLDPYPIRPAAVLRMPKFNMNSEEATKLANYFAALDNADFPYEYDARRQQSYTNNLQSAHPKQMDDALNIVVNNNYCVKCHLVGDFQPKGSATALAPQLDSVYRRLRPDYLRRWIANPKRILPYTGMPVNIPYKSDPPHFGGISQDIYQGTSIEQLDGLVDFLMNFDTFSSERLSIKPLVKPAPVAPAATPEATGSN